MLSIEHMSSEEVTELLQAIGYGHLGCLKEGKPYVIPMQYYIKDKEVYLFTDRSEKSHDLDRYPDICLQVEELYDPQDWQSVVITGTVERLCDRTKFTEIARFISTQNPTFAPVINQNITDLDVLENAIAIYRIQPSKMSGTKTELDGTKELIS